MAKHYATTLTALGIGLLMLPEVFAAEMGVILQPIADLLGRDGLGSLYAQFPLLIDSVIALMIFVGLGMKTLGERLGKPVAIGVGLMLAIGFVTGAALYSFSFADLAPLAILIIMGLLAYAAYEFLQPLIENRVLAFAFAFAVIGAMLYALFPGLPEDYPETFQWVGLLLAISTIIALFALIRMITNGLGGGSGSFSSRGGSGFGFGGNSFGGGASSMFDRGLEKIDDGLSSWNAKRKERAQKVVSAVEEATKAFADAAKKQAEEEARLDQLRTYLQQLEDYIKNVEREIEPYRIVRNGNWLKRRNRFKI